MNPSREDHQPLTQSEINEWINSLNPVEIRVDSEGDLHPEDVQNLANRLNEEITRIQEKK